MGETDMSVNNMHTMKFYLLLLQKLKEQAMEEGKDWILSTEHTGHSGLTIGKWCVIFKGRLARVSKEILWKTQKVTKMLLNEV